MIESLRRGVLRISELGFYVLFVPISERARVERDLAAAHITMHGTALHTLEEAESLFVVVVKSESAEKLRSIAHVLGSQLDIKRPKES